MPDFNKIERPLARPTACVICHTHGCPDGFIDTGQELPMYGRVYICGWCIASAAKMQGFADGVVHEKLRADFANLLVTVDGLEGELDAERDKKLVSVTDLEKVISARKLAKAT